MSESLKFQYQVRRSDNNMIMQIPSLTGRNLILSKIDFEADYWFFEAVLRSNAQDLVRLTSTYFQHHQELDLSKFEAKLEEGDKLELHVKPKASPKNINLTVTYHYSQSEGTILCQDTVRLTELKESTFTLLSDLSQNHPTKLLIRTQDPVLQVALTPKFQSEQVYPSWSYEHNESEESRKMVTLDFSTDEDLKSILPMLRYYDLAVRTDVDEKKEMDAQLYFLCYGFK